MKVVYIYKNRRCNFVHSYVNSNESNNLNISNTDNVIGTSNFPHINIQNYSLFNTLVTLKQLTYTESSVGINYELMDENSIRE